MRRLVFLLCIISVIGCANARLQQFYKNMDESVNIMTFDEAIMNWGSPTSMIPGEDIVVATWNQQSTGAVAVPIGNMVYAAPVTHGWELQLTFDKMTRKMIYWRYKEW